MTTPTLIQKSIDDTIAALTLLRATPYAEGDLSLALNPRLECDLAYRFVELLAQAFDAPLYAVAKDMSLDNASDYDAIVSNSICDICFDIQRKRKSYGEEPRDDYEKQHRLTARDLGVGRDAA